MSDSPSLRTGRTPVHRPWWRRPLALYLVLLAASYLVRRTSRPEPVLKPGEVLVVVPSVTADGTHGRPIRLVYEDLQPQGEPDPPVVLLLHGSPGDHGAFWAVAPALAQRFRVVAPDLPGFGRSSHDVPDYSIRAHARYVLELLDSLQVRRAHVVGFSLGGGVALEMAALAPERVKSIVLLSSIGAQEYELLGDYHLNHAIHLLQLVGLWLVREGVPHFGYLDDAMLGVPYARNFADSDQRPLRRILEHYGGPMLIIHGEHDPLVAPAAAREHYRLVPQSELLLLPGEDHFMVFMRPEKVAQPIADFLGRVEHGAAPTRATADPTRVASAERPFDPRTVPHAEGFALAIALLLIAGATLVSEDLTCIGTGLLVARGTIPFVAGTVACFVGIFVGDLLLFLAGRWLGRPALARVPLKWVLSERDVERSSQWFARRAGRLVLTTRFLPGTRLPTYFAAGMLHTRFWSFTSYFFLACALWTPALVGSAALLGSQVQQYLSVFRHNLWLYLPVTAGFLFLVLKLVVPLFSWRGRRLLLGAWRRWTRWEFWPRWLFYPPVVLYAIYLSIKHRGLTLFTAVNPAIPGGGFVGESKSRILQGLNGADHRVARYELIPAALSPMERQERAKHFLERWDLTYPVVLKPDIGERGNGTAIVRTADALNDYLTRTETDTIIQEFVAGVEFGVFYYRYPGAAAGSVFAVTEKRFPTVVGDGQHSLEELILADDRAVCMAPYHLRMHAPRLTWVPGAGEAVRLVELGTHCRGAAFYDGGWTRTPELEAATDRISRGFDGFYFGRYDVRTASAAEFQAGRFTIIELNGATSEATSIYDPKNSVGTAYRILFEQWRILFEIAARNRRAGATPASLGELFSLILVHHRALRSTPESRLIATSD